VPTLSCFLCGKPADPQKLQTVCECGRPLKFDLGLKKAQITPKDLDHNTNSLWRYAKLLPACDPVTLGEGATPLIPAHRLHTNWFIKDEGVNPTASFKARGMSLAVSMAKKLGAQALAVPSAGNAASALSAYAAAAQIPAFVFMPSDTPHAFIVECRSLGAQVTLVDGLITDCAAEIARRKQQEGWFDLSTLKEPYRVEGKKTMGYEVFEQFNQKLPDVIVYPAGGGTGLIGMAKAFDEMEQLGWIGAERPRMVAVQAAGCAPIVQAFQNGERFAEPFPNAATVASGLRVPRAIGDFLMLDAIRATHGTALTATDREMIESAKKMAARTGVFACPEGGATLAAAEKLTQQGWIKPQETVVLFNTGSGLKYLEALA